MTTKVLAIVLLFISTMYVQSATQVLADDSPSQEYNLPKPLDSTAHKVIDSVKTVKEKTVVLKEDLKDKVALLQYQQKEIQRTQHLIDSLSHVAFAAK